MTPYATYVHTSGYYVTSTTIRKTHKSYLSRNASVASLSVPRPPRKNRARRRILSSRRSLLCEISKNSRPMKDNRVTQRSTKSSQCRKCDERRVSKCINSYNLTNFKNFKRYTLVADHFTSRRAVGLQR